MAEEKPHEATPGKIRKARREGNVARSNELSGVFSFVAAAMTVMNLAPNYGTLFHNLVVTAVRGYAFSYLPFAQLALYMLLPMIVAGVTGAFIGMLQTKGPVVKGIKLDFKRISPVEGFKKMFSGEAVFNAVRAFLSFTIAMFALRPILEEIFRRGILLTNPLSLAVLAQTALGRVINTIFMIGLVFAGVDYFFALKRWKKGLRMTNEEMKREYKENNGDPQIKNKRRQFHRGLLRGAPTQVKDASVVVANPTHFAVALKYDPPRVPVPRILCRGADEMAFEVRRLAYYYGVPIVENVALARELFARGRPGKEIPEDTFVAVAEIVAALLKDTTDGKIPRDMNAPVHSATP